MTMQLKYSDLENISPGSNPNLSSSWTRGAFTNPGKVHLYTKHKEELQQSVLRVNNPKRMATFSLIIFPPVFLEVADFGSSSFPLNRTARIVQC